MAGVDVLATAFSGGNAAYLADLYARWVADPGSVDPSFVELFSALDEEAIAPWAEANGMPDARATLIAKTLSFIAGTTTAYLINRRWTFQAEPSRARFIAVVILYAVTFGLQVGINQLFYLQFAGESWRRPVAFVIAQGTATVINFVVQRAVIFRLK